MDYFMIKTKYLSIGAIVLILILLSGNDLIAQRNNVMQAGEELEYEVSFMKIKLGKIRVVTEANETLNGQIVHRAKAFMESYSGIPFVDLQTVYASWIDRSVSFSHRFEGNTKMSGNIWQFQRIDFDYEKEEIVNEKWENRVSIDKLVTKNSQKVNDGCSLFFLARQYANMKRSVRVPTLIDTQIGTTFINFHARKETVSIPAINYPVRTLYLDGRADWEGVYGLSGRFEGWFTDCEARIPIRARMNVYVGNVIIELVKWNREGWTPPRAE